MTRFVPGIGRRDPELLPAALVPHAGTPLALALLLLWLLPSLAFAQPLVAVEGTVELQTAAGAPWLPATAGDTLEIGGSLRTFQGTARLELADAGELRVAADSEFARGPRSYRLLAGHVFVQAEGVTFDLGGPLQVSGEVRLDSDAEAGLRVAVISGSARATLGARVVTLEAGQQLSVTPGADPVVSEFSEDDPWYRGLVVATQGKGQVLGFLGVAELRTADGHWSAAEVGATFTAGMSARTGADAWLELQFEGDSLVRLQADTEAELLTHATFEDGIRRTILALHQGTLWVVVSDGESFEIRTPDLVAGVRGTTFRLDAASSGAPPLLKVFEGEVVAVAEGATVAVPAGSQFDVDSGLATLVRDDLDEFNLERDRRLSLIPTELTLAQLPTEVVGADLLVTGRVVPPDAAVTVQVAGSVHETVAAGSFRLTVGLAPGFNLLRVRAAAEGATTVTRTIPLIRRDGEPFLAIATERVQDRVRVRGVTAPGARVRLVLADGSRTVRADDTGRFAASLPAAVGDLLVSATDARGDAARRLVPAGTF